MPGTRGARTLSRQAEERRDKILEAALEVISRKGFHKTSIADIAGRSRVSRATVYQYFADKRDVLVALADRMERTIIGTVDAWVPLPSTATQTITAVSLSEEQSRALIDQMRLMIDTRTRQILTAILANADAARLLLRLTRGNDRLVDDGMRRIDDHVIGVIAREIEAGMGYGWVRSCDARLIARYMQGGIEKLLIAELDRDPPLEIDSEALVREIGSFVFFGLAHPHFLALAAQPQTIPHGASVDVLAPEPVKPS